MREKQIYRPERLQVNKLGSEYKVNSSEGGVLCLYRITGFYQNTDLCLYRTTGGPESRTCGASWPRSVQDSFTKAAETEEEVRANVF